jgi:predicted dehydrogenase
MTAAAPPLRWAIVGPGRIAHRFAEAVTALPEAQLGWVCGRDARRVADFAARWTQPELPPVRVAADLASLLAEPSVDAVYVATPHALHGAAVAAALQAGKPVLCEKPLVPNRAQAEALVELARRRQVFLMEAVWTRFLPLYAVVGGWLRDQAIGELRSVQSSFCFAATYDPRSRLFDPALAGGALLDIGIYNVTVTRWALAQALGACPPLVELTAHAMLAPTGVEQRVAATLLFDRVASQFVCGFDGTSDNGLTLMGDSGFIRVPHSFWRGTEAVLQRTGQPAERVEAPLSINGFEGEIAEATRCIRAGQIESAGMPHQETIATLDCIDRLRARLGVRYPFE